MALVGFAILVSATALRLWAVLTLLHRYRASEYLSSPRARVFYVANAGGGIVMVGAIVFLCALTRIWWVEAFSGILALAFSAKLGWALWMRLSGRAPAFYAARRLR